MYRQERKIKMENLSLLKLRNAIADKERFTACANRELQQLGQWNCDWQEGFEQVDREIAEIIKEIEKDKKEN